MMTIDIICPVCNAGSYIDGIVDFVRNQKDVNVSKLRFVLTESDDDSENKIKKYNLEFTKVKRGEFSHSLTRENEAMKSDADILVFITQDIVAKNEYWLKNLISPIEKGECEACYSRQISKFNNIEKYSREKNYPPKSFIKTKDDIKILGLNTFFFSDASSAIKASVFKELNGYDGKNLPTNEDMYIAYKIIMAGYKIKYCAESEVFHSHNFTLKQLYKRYYLTGKFMAVNKEIYKYGITKVGGSLAKYILLRALKEFNVKVLFCFLPDMITRWIGLKNGEKFAKKCKI